MLLGTALLFWGWETHMMTWAIPMAAACEGSRLIQARWDFSRKELERIWDLCVLLVAAVSAAFQAGADGGNASFHVGALMPLVFFPMILAQTYGNWAAIPLGVMNWFQRRRPEAPLARAAFHLSYPYFFLCLLATNTVNAPRPMLGHAGYTFFAGMVLLISAGLLAGRSRRFPAVTCLALLALMTFGGYQGQTGLQSLQNALDGALSSWISSLLPSREDAWRVCHTQIGKVERLSLSRAIVARLTTEPGDLMPPLLREATYIGYDSDGTWRSSKCAFSLLNTLTNNSVVIPAAKPKRNLDLKVRIAVYLPGGYGSMLLPHGAFELDEFYAELATNRYGMALATNAPGLLECVAHFCPGASFDGPNDKADLEVPDSESVAVQNVVTRLGLNRTNLEEIEKLNLVRGYFETNFTYTLDLTADHADLSVNNPRTALAQFLEVTHAGHCEFFATAATLILREAGIPARYAIGYALNGATGRNGAYLLRASDAHAWVLVWRADRQCWDNFDPTPASSLEAGAAQVSLWDSASDFFSDLYFRFSRWRYGKESIAVYFRWLLLPLILVLSWRIFTGKWRRSVSPSNPPAAVPIWPGSDSEFFSLERQAAESGLGRRPEESLRDWRRRLAIHLPQLERLDRILALHQRLRFDPRGVTAEERQSLRQEVQLWLASFNRRATTGL